MGINPHTLMKIKIEMPHSFIPKRIFTNLYLNKETCIFCQFKIRIVLKNIDKFNVTLAKSQCFSAIII